MSYASWAAAECPLRIDYAIEAIREVRRMASARLGVLGVLYGRLEGDTLRIVAARTAPAGADEHTWAKLSAAAPEGLVAAGLFAIREEVAMSRVESEVLRRQFPAPWQVALVMTRDGRAGFFAREHDGTLDPASSRGTFEVDEALELTTYLFGPEGGERPKQSRPMRSFAGGFSPAVWLLAGVLALMAGYGLATMKTAKRLQLGLESRGDRIVVSWDRAAVQRASSGFFEILDGPDRVTRALSPNDLASGHLTYLRRTGDVSVRLQSNGLDEATRFVGRAPASRLPEEIAALVHKSTDLLAKVVAADNQARDMQATIDRLSAKITQGKR